MAIIMRASGIASNGRHFSSIEQSRLAEAPPHTITPAILYQNGARNKMSSRRYLSLSVSPSAGGFNGRSWHQTGREAVFSFKARLAFARRAQEAGFDALWLPDFPHHQIVPHLNIIHPFEPQLLFAAIAAAVPDIGLVPTISSTFSHPYNVARSVATLDRISHGRAGANIVTSFNPTVARNFGGETVPDYARRFERADEYFQILKGLLESTRLDSELTAPPEESPYLYDPDLFQPIDFTGKHFQVAGPIATPMWNGERPMIATAGGSEHTADLGARHADAMYVAAAHRIPSMAFNADIRRRASALGRRAQDIVFLPGLVLFLGSNQEEARQAAEKSHLLSGDTRAPVEHLAALLAIPVDELPEDKPLTEDQLSRPRPGYARPIGFFNALAGLAREEKLTAHELGLRLSLGFGHRVFIGTPEQAADDLALWFESGAADGFIIHVSSVQDDFPIITDELMPLLRKRGIIRDGYPKGNLRHRFGLE